MSRNEILVVASLVSACTWFCEHAVAQGQFIFEGEATWTWEASSNGGTTWSRDRIEVGQAQRSILIRSWLSFPQVGPGGYFNGVSLDGTITHVGSPTISDTISDLYYGFSGSHPSFSQQIFGNVLKTDRFGDMLPPGQGSGWHNLSQPVNSLGQSRANPIGMLNYTLNLDGTLGDRSLGGVFQQRADFPLGRVVYVALTPFNDTNFLVPFLHHDPFIITVVPSPGSGVVVFFGLALAVRSRRRGKSPNAA